MEAIPQEPALDVADSPVDEPAVAVPSAADHPASDPSSGPSFGPATTADGSSQEAVEQPRDDSRDHRFECRSCGFVFDPSEGIRKLGIDPGVAFEDLDPLGFRCPVCRSRVGAFMDIGPRNKPSGFEENLGFGLGVNKLTPGQKNVLIFSAFALAIAFFLSLYSLR
ncbi:MAG: rubredoxin [Prochlorococcaceae cyanobacterium]